MVPVLNAMGIEPITAAMMNLRDAGMIERVAPGQHRLTRAGIFATIPLDSAPWRAPEPISA